MDNRGGRKGLDKTPAVAFRTKPGVEDGQNAAIFSMTDEAAEALLRKLNRRLGHGQEAAE